MPNGANNYTVIIVNGSDSFGFFSKDGSNIIEGGFTPNVTGEYLVAVYVNGYTNSLFYDGRYSIQIWEQFINESLNHCDEIYAKLNVTLTRTHLDAESKYNDALPGIISQLESRGLLSESEGAKCVFLPQFLGKDGDSLPVIVQKPS